LKSGDGGIVAVRKIFGKPSHAAAGVAHLLSVPHGRDHQVELVKNHPAQLVRHVQLIEESTEHWPYFLLNSYYDERTGV
jgi:hypothetical protein